jgi:cytochrome c oxidase assembly protein subunit 15
MNSTIESEKDGRSVAIWLLTGVAMIMIQVLLGGITRLTGSGLSITEWKPILGALPPVNEKDWLIAFEKYKQIGQFKHINFDFSLSDFKFIYFWEWFHRVWARLIGIVFLIPFLYFIIRKKINGRMVIPMVVLFLLGALQGAVGWIMVKSGLNEEDIRVSHIRLAIHFMCALGLLSYTLWFALGILIKDRIRPRSKSLRYGTYAIILILILQLTYGAFMAGLKAGSFAPTWPDINGSFWPGGVQDPASTAFMLSDDPIMVQFIHRGLAYLLTFSIILWYLSVRRSVGDIDLFDRYRHLPLVLVVIQLILGIFTVLNSADPKALLWLGVAHQFAAMLLLMSFVLVAFLLYRSGNSSKGS